MTYKTIKYTGDWDSFNEAAFQQAVEATHRENLAVQKELLKLHRDLLEKAAQLYGRNSRQFAYLRRE